MKNNYKNTKLINANSRISLRVKIPAVIGGVLASLCLLATSAQATDYSALDEAYTSIPDAAAVNQIDAYSPAFDFDGDGCLPAAAISRAGIQNGGLSTSGTITGGCRTSNFLDESNTYHRYVIQVEDGVEYSAHAYELYFEKDQATDYFGGGHRHDVETVVIYLTDRIPTHMAVSAHGEYTLKAWSDIDTVGSHPKVVYHKDGVTTHAFRHATDSSAENPYGEWVLPNVVSWYEMTGDGVSNAELIAAFNDNSYGSASFKTKDSRFIDTINDSGALPDGYPTFNQESAEQSQYGNNLKEGVVVKWTNHNEYSTTEAAGSTIGQYVRVSHPSSDALSLAEVEVIDIFGNNVALGKTASQSSTAYSGVASRAVDGNTNGAWSGGSVTHTAGGVSDAWWLVDLGSDVEIAEIRIYNRTDSCCTSRLNDAEVTIVGDATVQWINHDEYTQTNPIGPNIGRYVKVSHPTSDALSLAEVEVIDIYGNNAALGKTASQSSTAYSGVASRATDGNTNGRYSIGSVTHTAGGASDAWWLVDLGSDTEISEVIVYNRTDSCCTSRLNDAEVEIIEE